jgi:hypothetical protein
MTHAALVIEDLVFMRAPVIFCVYYVTADKMYSARHIAASACGALVDDADYGACHTAVFSALTRQPRLRGTEFTVCVNASRGLVAPPFNYKLSMTGPNLSLVQMGTGPNIDQLNACAPGQTYAGASANVTFSLSTIHEFNLPQTFQFTADTTFNDYKPNFVPMTLQGTSNGWSFCVDFTASQANGFILNALIRACAPVPTPA